MPSGDSGLPGDRQFSHTLRARGTDGRNYRYKVAHRNSIDVGNYDDRFQESTYVDDQPVCISVFTSDRNAPATVCLPESLFRRAQGIATAYMLHLLPTIEIYAETTLSKSQCSTLRDELSFIAGVVSDSLLVKHLRAAMAALNKGVQFAGDARVLIEGP